MFEHYNYQNLTVVCSLVVHLLSGSWSPGSFLFDESSIVNGVASIFSIFMAPLALFNEGVPTHFFHLMEAPTMRHQNAKKLLCWPSRMHIYL